MSGYVRQIEVTIPFDGGTARLRLKPLTRGDMFKLQSAFPDLRPGEKPTAAQSLEAFQSYAAGLKGYIVSCEGVLDAAGQEVPVDEWVDSAYFVGLVGEVMAAHMERATPSNP